MKPIIIKIPNSSDRVVATRSVTDQTVVAHGRNLRSVLRKASEAGAKRPAIMFVPRENTRYVF